MPYAIVRFNEGGVTADRERQVVEGIADTSVRAPGERPAHTHVVADEVEPEKLGFAGMLTTDYRKGHERRALTTGAGRRNGQ